MPEHACRWNLIPGLDQCGHVASGHDRSYRTTPTNHDFAGAVGRTGIGGLGELNFLASRWGTSGVNYFDVNAGPVPRS